MEIIGIVRPTNLRDIKNAKAAGFSKVEAKIFTRKDIAELNSLRETGLEIVEIEIIGEDPAIWKLFGKEDHLFPLLIDGTEADLRRATELRRIIPELEILVEFLPAANPYRRGEKDGGRYKGPTSAKEMLNLLKKWPVKVLIDFNHIVQSAIKLGELQRKDLPLCVEIEGKIRTIFSSETIADVFQTLKSLRQYCWPYAHFADIAVATRLGRKPHNDRGNYKKGYDVRVIYQGQEMYASSVRDHLHIFEGDIFRNLSLRQVLQKLEKIGIRGLILETADRTPTNLRRDMEIIKHLSTP